MKRKGYLFEKVISLENLILAEKNAKKGKTRKKDIIDHEKHRECNILKLRQELINRTYKTSEYYIFKLYEPKERLISKLPFKDRIIHHAVLNITKDLFINCFITQTYSCIPKRGIHKCLNDVKKALKDNDSVYCLKLDIKKFYQSINNEKLKGKLRTKFKDKNFLWLLDEIIDSNKEGVPLGNYTSQFFANFYLNSFDHELKQNSGIKYYFRYTDDIVIFHKDKKFLKNLLDKIESLLLSLDLKISKSKIFPTVLGIDFVGYKIFKDYVLLRKSIKLRFIKMIKKDPNLESISSYYGWIKHCNGINLWKKYTKDLI